MWRTLTRITLAAAGVALSGVASAAPDPHAMAQSVNSFAVDLYRHLASTPGNLAFSPFSISHAIGMARAGARGETAAQIDRVLHLPGDFARRQQALTAAIAPPRILEWDARGKEMEVPAYRLDIANAIWGQAGFKFLDPFLEVMQSTYGAPLERVDFRDGPRARQAINSWVAGHTDGRIENIVPPGKPAPDSRLILVNALYFKASWATSFAKGATSEATWHAGDGGSRPIRLMRRVGRVAYHESEDLQVAELPYRGDACSMLIILPRARDGLPAIERSLSREGLARWIDMLQPRRLDLRVPRFTFTSEFQLAGSLGELGMPLAFSREGADFSAISTTEPLMIGDVLHKSFIGVDEDGTEAAAATAVIMPARAAIDPDAPTPFIADHPFLFAIRHRESGVLLFIGRASAP